MNDLRPPRIWVDADACPRPIKEVLYKAADRRQIDVIFVSNHFLNLPSSPRIKGWTVSKGQDVADQYIVSQALAQDLIITQDIPLASDLIEKGCTVINLRGTEHTPNTIGERLSIRNAMEELRDSGVMTGGPPPFGAKEKQAFSNQFDRVLTRIINQAKRKALLKKKK
jgi:uncharacterized protein YaiI (UPF0178 family)